MGLFWEAFQEYQIGSRRGENSSLEQRVEDLENEVIRLETALGKAFTKLEAITGQDLGDEDIAPAA